MNLQQAYSVLGIPPTSTPEEAKKQFKKLSKEFHPDINKSPDAEAQFKKINEAYQVIQAGKNSPQDWDNPFRNDRYTNPFSSIFNVSSKTHLATDVKLNITISFKESVQGCKKDMSYSRKVKCPHCQGNGNKPINNGCQRCGGCGQISTQGNGAIFIQSCPDCRGNNRTIPCDNCSTSGVITSQSSIRVSIPIAVSNNTILHLGGGIGNFSGSFMGIQDRYTDVLLTINVIPDPNLQLVGKDLVSNIHISLFEALTGCTKIVPSLNGDKEIQILGGTKNKDEIPLTVGDENNITHRVVLNVDYPANINKLIDVLSEKGN